MHSLEVATEKVQILVTMWLCDFVKEWRKIHQNIQGLVTLYKPRLNDTYQGTEIAKQTSDE